MRMCMCVHANIIVFWRVALSYMELFLLSSQTRSDNECVFSNGSETALRTALCGIMHIYVGINRQNALKYSNVKWLLLIKLLRLSEGCVCVPQTDL